MSRLLRCEKCNKKVAEVRDASIMKGMTCFCPQCHQNNKAKIAAAKYYAENKGGPPDWLRNIFGG